MFSREFLWVRSCCLAKWHIHLAGSRTELIETSWYFWVIYLSRRHQGVSIYFWQHVEKILSTMTKIFSGLFAVFVCIFDNMLKIFITPSNRELSICDSVRKILNLMTKICMVFFGVFVFCWYWSWKPEMVYL